MKKTVLLAGALLASLQSHPVTAQSLPRYDVKAHCREVAAFGGAFSESTMDGCMQMEQTAYDQLKRTFPDLSTSMRKHCDEVASFGGHGSYSTLQGCIQMEQSSARRNAGTEFKY
ncbi:MAG: hypothetical protein DI565_13015 [Ancylobacter novellus]|uniref:Uncharacterized protein n=1 Tax=Ancylobacter novellus TaxID=921 RepID=A0A2W5MA80_ANCNO|nr:MAG: hypothetical protein DI565_13015 [Ancylobacter novellus]